MQYVYSALLLHAAKKDITEEGVKKILEASGAEADAARIKALVASLDGVNIEEAIKEASTMMAAPAQAPASSGDATEDKKEEKTEEDTEKKAEEAAAGLSSLFG